MFDEITPAELAELLAEARANGTPLPLLLDVREDWEWTTCHLPDATHMPLKTVSARLAELDKDRDIVCICHHGGRSAQVARFLADQGFHNVLNMTGGIHRWAQTVDPAMPVY